MVKRFSALIFAGIVLLLGAHHPVQASSVQLRSIQSPSHVDTAPTSPDFNQMSVASQTVYWLCDIYDESCAAKPQGKARFQIMAAGYQPSRDCADSPFCLDSFATLVQVTIRMGRTPTMPELLYMIAGTEYFAYVDYPAQGVQSITARQAGQEALARNYYAACGTDACWGDELYQFFSAYQPWYGDPYKVEGSYLAAARAIELLNTGLFNDFLGTGPLLWEDIGQILDLDYASSEGRNWTDGRNGDRPWSWFGLLRISSVRQPLTYGLTANKTALMGLSAGDGYVFLMFTGDQDLIFNQTYLSP